MTRVGWLLPVALAVVPMIGGCARTAESPRQSLGEGIHGLWIREAILVRFQADRVLAPLGLTVETSRGEVFVSGLAHSDTQRGRAVAVAQEVSGVTAAYFVDMDRPDRPVSHRQFRAAGPRVWEAGKSAVRSAGYGIESEVEGQMVVSGWRRVPGSWRTLWVSSHERLHLRMYHHADLVTVIAVVNRLDEADFGWQTAREQAVLRGMEDLLKTGTDRPDS
jgi:hypothetical protein